AMIEQVCSMALTLAHHEGREAFDWPDLIEAMATVESGTAEAIEYAPHETKAVAIHEAGHAACGHVFMGDRFESTRLSVRKRGSALGHHMAAEREERFTTWQHEEMGTPPGRSGRWRRSTCSTARTRAASSATSRARRRRQAG